MVPKLRFKEFCGEWEEKRLGDIGFFKNGISKGNEYFGRGYKFVNLQDVFNTNYLKNKNYGLVELTEKELLENNLRKGDVIFVRSSVKPSGVGLTSVVLEELVDTAFAGFLIRFREYDKVLDLNYKKYCFYFPGFRNELLKRSTISANTNINQDNLAKLKINIPSLPEQTKIADFLSTVDDKIQNQQGKITHLENIKKGFMQKIFSRKIRFKDDGGEEFPEWEEKKLGDIRHTITKGTTPKQFIETKEINFIKIESIDDVNILNSRCLNISKDVHYGDLKRSILEENDILFSIAGSLGRCCIVKKENLPANTNQALAIIRIRKDIDHRFILNILQSSIMKNYIYKNITVGAQPNLSLEQVANFKFPLPCLKEQQKIADFLLSFDEKIATEKETLEHLKQFKKGLLQQMFV